MNIISFIFQNMKELLSVTCTGWVLCIRTESGSLSGPLPGEKRQVRRPGPRSTAGQHWNLAAGERGRVHVRPGQRPSASSRSDWRELAPNAIRFQRCALALEQPSASRREAGEFRVAFSRTRPLQSRMESLKLGFFSLMKVKARRMTGDTGYELS